jgi:alkanesulfonate monooxygenase SsuD/methylene tetrahydromethanopterin reductase-like flavin-dependent oxidoreductase (luciferase family)
MRHAVSIPSLTEPGDIVALGQAAEASGWDGAFVWDHIHGGSSAPLPIAEAWTVLGALAARTTDIRIGPMVTPLARRRPQKVAREAVTVDRLSGGRMVLGVGLGNPADEFTAFGEDADPLTRAEKLDEALDVVVALWSGRPVDHEGRHYTVHDAQFQPTPVNGTIPVWAACTVRRRAPIRRAARRNGIILAGAESDTGISEVTPGEVRVVGDEVTRLRGALEGFDIAVLCSTVPNPRDVDALEQAGATWVVVTGWIDQLRNTIDAGPPH